MKRIVTNLVKLNKLKQRPCERWLKYFDKNGIADAHKAFVEEDYYPYDWIYKNTNIDLITWEIENNCFDWKQNSWAVAKYCSSKLNVEKYNWKYSYYVAHHCPDKIDPDKYNWEKDSWAVAEYCPEKLDPGKFNWKEFSCYVARYCPDKLDPERYDWEKQSCYVAVYCPDKIDPEKFNWKENIWTVIRNSLDQVIENSDKINWEEIRSHYSYHERRKMLKYIRILLKIPKGVKNEISAEFRKLLLS